MSLLINRLSPFQATATVGLGSGTEAAMLKAMSVFVTVIRSVVIAHVVALFWIILLCSMTMCMNAVYLNTAG